MNTGSTSVPLIWLTYDNNGNTLTDENGQSYTYDAWNRQVTAKNSSGATIATYSYDPTGRRITETTGNATTDVYFTDQWQDIEERQSGTVTRQNVWGLGYVNQLVERDDNSTSGDLGAAGSGLGERLYAQQDANWSVTSLVDTSGNVVERITYLPYGGATFLTSSWLPTTDAFEQNTLFQGGQYETATGNYLFGYRDYDPTSGTWKEQDPLGYIDGPDRNALERSNPIESVDPFGLNDSDCSIELDYTTGQDSLQDLIDDIAKQSNGKPISDLTLAAHGHGPAKVAGQGPQSDPFTGKAIYLTDPNLAKTVGGADTPANQVNVLTKNNIPRLVNELRKKGVVFSPDAVIHLKVCYSADADLAQQLANALQRKVVANRGEYEERTIIWDLQNPQVFNPQPPTTQPSTQPSSQSANQ
jgi:RHS repeat-associated protein